MSPASTHQRFKEHVQFRMNKDGKPMPFPFIVLGLVGESAEAMAERDDTNRRQELIEETGDALWYAEAVCACFGTSVGKLVTHLDGKTLFHHLGAIAELAKKEAWHGKPAPAARVLYHLGAVVKQLDITACLSGFTLEEAMEANIVKLEKRYPRGFVEGGGVREPAAQLAPAVGSMLPVQS